MASSTVTVSGWTSLGSGSMIVDPRSMCGVWLVDAASQPASNIKTGDIYLSGGGPELINAVSTLWALPGNGMASAIVGVWPQ